MLYRTNSGGSMITEETILPPWVTSANTRLREEGQRDLRSNTVARIHGIRPAEISEDRGETVGGTVSRKGGFGYLCEKCPHHGMGKSLATSELNINFLKHWSYFPIRCKPCKSKMKRYSTASRNYKALDLLRQIEERPNLKFMTKTRKNWSIRIPFEQGYRLWEIADDLKKKAYKSARNWRSRNKYWLSREAKGMIYPEIVVTPVWPYDEIKLHFHMHMIVCSKRIENKDIQTDLDTLEPIPMSTTIQRNWGGIVDVRKCKTWKHKDGEVKTSRRFVMNYLLDYINKAAHWQSSKFGDWSS